MTLDILEQFLVHTKDQIVDQTLIARATYIFLRCHSYEICAPVPCISYDEENKCFVGVYLVNTAKISVAIDLNEVRLHGEDVADPDGWELWDQFTNIDLFITEFEHAIEIGRRIYG